MRNSKGRKYGLGTGTEGIIDASLLMGPGDTIVSQKKPVLTPAQQKRAQLQLEVKARNAARLAPVEAQRQLLIQQWTDANPGSTTKDYWKWQEGRNKGEDAGISGLNTGTEKSFNASCGGKGPRMKTNPAKLALGTGEEGILTDPIVDPTKEALLNKIKTTAVNSDGTFNTKKIVNYQPGVSNDKMGSGFYLYSKNVSDPGFDVTRDREFVKQAEMMAVQKTPEWKEYMATQKFANGTGASGVTAKNYMQSPSEALAENDILMAKATADANDNPLAIGVQIAGQIGSSIAGAQTGKAGQTNLISNDIKGSGEGTFLNNPNFEVMTPAQSQMFEQGYAAMGMNDAEGQIEAEGGEVVETPGGEPAELKGPKHTQGGIDMNVPEGTKIYSDQLKGADGKTMADRKKARERKELKLDELLATNKGDKAIANSHKRMRAALDLEEQNDLQMQELATQFTQMQEFAMGTGSEGVKMAGGTGPFGLPFPKPEIDTNVELPPPVGYTNPDNLINNFGENLLSYSPEIQAPVSKEVQATGNTINLPTTTGNTDPSEGGLDFTTGDVTGLLGNAVSMFAPMNNTLKNRASDTVNKNMYEDYGDDALATNADAQNLLAGNHDNDLQRVTRSANGAKRQGRKSATSINTMRATDLAVDINSNDANANLSDQYAKQMMAMLGQKSSLQASIGQVKAAGATAADLANRQDKDNFYTQLGKDKATIGQGLQQTGKDLNQLAQNETMMNMVNQMSKYFKFDKNNKIIAVNKQTKK